MKLDYSHENRIWFCTIGIILLVQILIYIKSYCKCFESPIHGQKMKRGEIWGYWWKCLVFLGGNAILFAFQGIWLPTLKENGIVTGITIITTVLISFFGLTAASYTFQINDLHEQQRAEPNDVVFINEYLEITRFKFTAALWATVLISACSIGVFLVEGLATRQLTVSYKNEVGFILCSLAVESILWMMYLNWVLFFHERYIDKYAARVLSSVKKADKNRRELNTVREQMKRISDLELVFQRLLKNSIHVRGIYPLENQDLLAVLPNAALAEGEEKNRANSCVIDYHMLLIWRNAVVRNSKSRKNKRSVPITLSAELLTKLGEVECFIKKNCLKEGEFSGMDLSGLELLREGKMEGADFSGSNLQNIDLSGSDCTRANLSNVFMNRIHFTNEQDGKTSGVRISKKTKLGRINFFNSNMESSSIEYGSHKDYEHVNEYNNEEDLFAMNEGNFDNVIFSNSSFRNVNFTYSSFESTQMYYNHIDNCRLNLSVFRTVMLSNCFLEYSDFSKTNFSSAIIVSAKISYCCFREARMHKANLAGSIIVNGIWNKVLATGASMKGVEIYPSEEYLKTFEFQGDMVDFTQTVLKDVDFTECKIYGTDLSGSQINGCIFTLSSGKNNCFHNVDIRDCLFNGTKWDNCIFDFAQFDGSTFKNTEFSGGRFCRTQFDLCFFVNFDNNSRNAYKERRIWERRCNFDLSQKKEKKNGNSKAFFEGSYLEHVSFAGAKGLTEEMFKDAVIVGVNFQGTGISREKLKYNALKIKNCCFDINDKKHARWIK